MKTNTPLLDRLEDHGITADILARQDAYGVLYYLTQMVHQVNMGHTEAPSREHLEAHLCKQGIDKILEDTRLMRSYSLLDYISDEATVLKKASMDEFYRLYDKEDIAENWPDGEAAITPSIGDIFPRYDLDKLVDRIHGEEDVTEYAREHGRIEAGFDWQRQKLHAETDTGQNVKTWVQRLNDLERVESRAPRSAERPASAQMPVGAERQTIRDMIASMDEHPSVVLQMETQRE
ncbi:MAG: hypothetical protein WCO97_05920 [bacterium]